MPGRGNPLLEGPPSIFSGVNTNGTPMGFANTASTNVFTGPHVGEMPMQFANVASSVPQINDAGTTSNGMTVPTNRYPTDAQMGELYQQQRELAGVRTFGVPHDDWVEANANKPSGNVSATIAGGGGRAQSTGPAPIPEVLISQNLAQRPQTGNIYAPDLSAYNDSSLFNYAGPGGVDEYTYGQGLPYEGAGYDIWGSPTDIANPYYEGQFAPQTVGDGGFPATQITQPGPVGPADGAISLPPVEMPGDVPTTNITPLPSPPISGVGTPPSAPDLTYAETLAEMGINPADAPSTLFPSPGESNLSLAERQAKQMGADNWNAMVAQADAMDKQLMEGQLGSGFKGEEELNKDIIKTTLPPTLGTPNPQGGLPVPEFNTLPEQELTPLQQAARDASGNIDTRDFRFNPTGEQDKSLLQKWVEDGPAYQPTSDDALAEMEDTSNQVKTFADKTSLIRNMGAEPYNIFDDHFGRNQAEYTPSIRDYYPGATPMQLHEGEVLNAIKEGPKTGPGDLTTADLETSIFDYSADDRFRQIPQSIADVDYDARPMNRANAAADANISNAVNIQHPAYAAHQNRLENLFQNQETGFPIETRGSFAGSSADLDGAVNAVKTGISGKGGQTSIFNEQENYEVPGDSLTNGLIQSFEAVKDGAFSVDGSGTDRVKAEGEEAAWDKYYDYKRAGLEALKDGDIDVKAFNAMKGKAGSDTVIDHFINKDKNPIVNNVATTLANLAYQTGDFLVGDDSFKDATSDFVQQTQGIWRSEPLGSIAEEIALAKEATQQRKEVQENIFTPGPMKFAAVASKTEPVVVKKDKPSRKPVKKTTSVIKTSKPSRTPTKPKTTTVSSGPSRRGSRGGRKKPATKKTTSTFNRYGRRGGW